MRSVVFSASQSCGPQFARRFGRKASIKRRLRSLERVPSLCVTKEFPQNASEITAASQSNFVRYARERPWPESVFCPITHLPAKDTR